MSIHLRSIEVDESKLDEYVLHARDAAFSAGLAFFASKHKTEPDYNKVQFLTHTLFPSPFLRSEFEYAVRIQQDWNYLIHRTANMPELIHESLKDVIDKDAFFAKLWNIYQSTIEDSKKQPIVLNIMRADYFLDANKLNNLRKNPTALSQVEINTLGCGGTATPTKIVEFHMYMLKKLNKHQYIDKLAENNLQEKIVKGIIQAWRMYNNPNAFLVMAIRDRHFIYGDHRLIEYELLKLEPKLNFVRLTLAEMYKTAKLDDQNRLLINDKEVAMVYYRTGYDPSDYPTQNEWAARELIERSLAIKAPTISYQLVGSKKFQQFLYESKTIENIFQNQMVVDQLRATFVKQYSFGKDKNNKELIEMMKTNYQNLILKPQREGGGNNIYDIEIKNKAASILDESDLNAYILMDRIKPVEHYNFLLKQFKTIERLKVTTELGLFGLTISGQNGELILNEYAGFTFTTKDANCNEGGIFAGYGGWDTLFFDE